MQAEDHTINKNSAEYKAAQRMHLTDDESRWITAVEVGEEVDVDELMARLRGKKEENSVSGKAARSRLLRGFTAFAGKVEGWLSKLFASIRHRSN